MQLLEQAINGQRAKSNASQKSTEPQPSCSNTVMIIDSDDSKDFICEPQGLLIDNDVDVNVDVDVDIDVGMDIDIDLAGQLDLNLPDIQQDLEYDSN